MKKLVVVIMGQDCEKFLPMAMKSVEGADKIIYLDGGSFWHDMIEDICKDHGAEYIENEYNQEDKAMNGKQRNFYLEHVKKHYPDWWCLAIDADEVVEDLNKIKEFIQHAPSALYSVHMRHLIGDLGHEDATQPRHYVLHRLFKIEQAESYPLVEHPVLEGKGSGRCDVTTIWHLAYVPNMWAHKKRYDNHLAKSNMHSPEFLRQWYKAHLFGAYPKTPFDPVQLPDIILNEFGIPKDELYFEQRNIEMKHFVDAITWRDYFKPQSAVEYGCGKGPRVYAMNNVGIPTNGIEISKFAVNNKVHPNVREGDILTTTEEADLVIAYDILEHIDMQNLNAAIENLAKSTKKFLLVSVPVIGDPNLENDPTHKIKESGGWWVNKIENTGLKKIPTPEHFLFKDQLMIFKK